MSAPAAPLPLTETDKAILGRIAASTASPHREVIRAKVLLAAGEGIANSIIASTYGLTAVTVRAWRKDYHADGLTRFGAIASGRGRKRSIDDATIIDLVEKTMHQNPPVGHTHWSVRTMAKEVGISPATVQRIWSTLGIKPHRVDSCKISTDPQFTEKLIDVVGLYLNPPDKAVVVCMDEKSSIQALDRTQPSLPMVTGRGDTMTHDYKRNGTTTLFPALDVLTGKVIGSRLPKHRHQEFLTFLNTVDSQVPKGLQVHVILDNYATHKHLEVKKWLDKHPRFHFHFTPTSSSWLNQVERWFRELTDKNLKRGVFPTVGSLIASINRFLDGHNDDPRPYVWTATAEEIPRKVESAKAKLQQVVNQN
ncbi:IS630 family transposase [Corynebacterium pacaense]|uniref:IS630 family transposase n=1 Tax=Corynebacterium pacaense TaxID=1816684 RepID=UPI0009BA5D27|nr:IS630 family transposase [Corynebacterium pacaense]